jgi:hypothetical protein
MNVLYPLHPHGKLDYPSQAYSIPAAEGGVKAKYRTPSSENSDL